MAVIIEKIAKKDEVKAQPKPTHRYFCDACTGIAGYSSIPEAVYSMTCSACGKEQKCKKANWIKIK